MNCFKYMSTERHVSQRAVSCLSQMMGYSRGEDGSETEMSSSDVTLPPDILDKIPGNTRMSTENRSGETPSNSSEKARLETDEGDDDEALLLAARGGGVGKPVQAGGISKVTSA